MVMDVERRDDGRWHFSLGIIEKWIVTIVATAFLGGVYWFVSSTLGNQAETAKAINALATQQAVTNAQMTTLSTQLADVPSITRQMAEMGVQVKRNTDDISELRKLRGLK
jgi:hypothetical protein